MTVTLNKFDFSLKSFQQSLASASRVARRFIAGNESRNEKKKLEGSNPLDTCSKDSWCVPCKRGNSICKILRRAAMIPGEEDSSLCRGRRMSRVVGGGRWSRAMAKRAVSRSVRHKGSFSLAWTRPRPSRSCHLVPTRSTFFSPSLSSLLISPSSPPSFLPLLIAR